VIKNVVHVTVAGATASWYFSSVERRPVAASFKRATTTSFGTICFGSLVVAALQACATLGNLINRSGLARRQGGGGGGVAACILMCCGYCASNLVRLVRFFNHYAYTHVAIYGYAMVPAAKATYGLVKGVGLLPLMGNRLLQGVITVGCGLAGGLGAGIAALFLLLSPTLRELMTWGSPTPVSYEWALVWLCFTIGWLVSLPLLEIAQSVVCALFVCLAEQPEVSTTACKRLVSLGCVFTRAVSQACAACTAT